MPPKPIIIKPKLNPKPKSTNRRPIGKPMASFGVIQYKKGSHVIINKYLRRVGSSRIEDAPTSGVEGDHALMLRKIRDIDATMRLRGDGDLYKVLFRGCGYIDFGIRSTNFEDLKNLEGKTKIWWGYTSTTTNETVAKRYCKGVYIVINTLSGTGLFNMRDFSGLSCQGEDEVLIERGTKYCIDSVEQEEDKVKVTVTLQAKCE